MIATYLSLYLCYCTEVAEVPEDLPPRCPGHNWRAVIAGMPEEPNHTPMTLGHWCPDAKPCAATNHRTNPSAESATETEGTR